MCVECGRCSAVPEQATLVSKCQLFFWNISYSSFCQ